MNPEWIGSAAGFLTTIAYVPQLIKVVRERHTTSLSLLMYSLISSGLALWIAYGWMIDSWSLVIANGIAFLIAITILIFKLKHG